MRAVRLTHIDGKLPNLALMKLAAWHRERGDTVRLERSVERGLFEPAYNLVYGSAIFEKSRPLVDRLKVAYPGAIIGGTGTGEWQTVEERIGSDYERYDYSIYPEFPWSIGFTQRGCRLNCGFCVVPKKEGKPRSTNTIGDIWRGEPTPRNIDLLDNDFFGQPSDQWMARIAELQEGKYKVCFNQGVNVRLITDETAAALASVRYYDDQFKTRRLYTAWDNLGQERIFFRGFEKLVAAGVKPHHVMVYMLIGYAPNETFEEIQHRYHRLKDAGCLPYPMVYGDNRPDLKRFQKWVIMRYDEVVPWEQFRRVA